MLKKLRNLSLINLSSSSKHLLHCTLLTVILVTIILQMTELTTTIIDEVNNFNPIERYGLLLTLLLYLVRLLALLSLPQCIFNFLGLTLYNAFPEKVELKSSPLLVPFICFRVVTRGDYPDLVKRNVNRNLNSCIDVGLENFIFEIVTDKSIDIGKHSPRIRQLIVTKDYKTSTGALFKARALQFALEDEQNILSENDWIVHLDEETLLTENSLRGIINFIMNGKHEFGQGLITYANEEIVNWLTTLADTFRVTDDMGKLRFQFRMFHRPLFGWKGSFVVTKFIAERDVSFDHGLDGSVAEDCYFSMIAYQKGYTFEFINGEMWEKSPFTIKDFLQQRKRWMQGIFLVVHSKKINFSTKFFLSLSLYAWMCAPLSTMNIFLAIFFPLPRSTYILFNFLFAFVASVNIYMYIFGVFKSFSLLRLGIFKLIFCLLGAILTIPFNIIIENIAIIWSLITKKHKFYVVAKEITKSSSQVNDAV